VGERRGEMIDILKSTKEELIKEYDHCEKLWGKYSSDCFGFYISALYKRICELGGWERGEEK
jgi:hypothetical protein